MRQQRKAVAWGLVLLVWLGQIVPLAAQERGVGRLRVQNEKGDTEEIKLYDASYALVIGAGEYANGWPKLPGVKKDVPAVKAALERQGFKVETLLDPTRKQLKDKLDEFVETYGYSAGNRLLIYFAGHGYTGKSADGRELGYIVPVDAPLPSRDSERFRRTAISMNDIEGYATRIEAKHALFVFDSCFSGTLLSKTRSPVPAVITYKAALPVRQFITAGADDQEVPDVSIFRQQFVEGLNGAADLNGDKYITGTELAEYLQTSVTNYTKEAQTPQYGKIRDGRLDKGDLVFIVPGRNNTPPPPETTIVATDSATVELGAWNDIKESRQIEDFRAFVREFPNGKYAAQAKIRLEQLAWEGVAQSNDLGAVQAFLAEFGSGANAPRARLKRDRLLSAKAKPAATPAPGPRVEPTPAPTNATPATSGRRAGEVMARNRYQMDFVWIPAGTFQMGEGSERHEVTLSQPVELGQTEVTQGQWQAVMGNNPSNFKNCADCPVEQVSWEDAQGFITKLNGVRDGYTYRLPTEAEWEYAARAGTKGSYGIGDGENLSSAQANFDGNYPAGNAPKGQYLQKTVAVKSYQPNGWGLYDMHGNVWEWVQDWYGAYPSGKVTDPSGPTSGSSRVLRGGGWGGFAAYSRSAGRVAGAPGDRAYDLGFRLARTPS